MSAMSATEFERAYRADPDPWNYTTSDYERRKYRATLEACGSGPFDHALELGGSIGVFSAKLAPRCRRLTTVDFSATAVRLAEVKLRTHPQVTALLGAIPTELPAGPFDLIVASEVLYYLQRPSLETTLARLRASLVPGGRIVCVHWRPAGPERPVSAEQVHDAIRSEPWLEVVASARTDGYLLDVLERRAGETTLPVAEA